MKLLRINSKNSIRTTANTIFPKNIYSPSSDADDLYNNYARIWPKIKSHKIGRRKPNWSGTYFQRFIAYPNYEDAQPVNQLDAVIGFIKSGLTGEQRLRKSSLQMCAYDPIRDCKAGPYLPFPCLQSVSIAVKGSSLILTAVYPRHYMISRGYGNYMGLVELGQFIAKETCCSLEKVVVISSYTDFPPSDFSKSDISNSLCERIDTLLGDVKNGS